MLRSRILALSVVFAALTILSVPVSDCLAESRVWTGVRSNDWHHDINWSPRGGPDPSDWLNVLSGSPYTYCNADTITDNGGSITIDGSSASVAFNDLYVAEFGAASMSIQNDGYVSSSHGYLGYEAGSLGTAIITGDDSEWFSHNGLDVGYRGTGTVQIADGGRLSSWQPSIGSESGSNGTVIITGEGSGWSNTGDCRVGRYGTGTFEILNGAHVLTSWSGIIGSYAGSDGTVTVTGADSRWSIHDRLLVGSQGTGRLNITDGGKVQNSDKGRIGGAVGSNGEVTVTGAGSTWTNGEELYVGYYSTGTLNIQNGGYVKNYDDGFIGLLTGSDGTVTVTDPGAMWSNRVSLYIGGSNTDPGGLGELNVSNSGSIEVRQTLKVWGGGTLNIGATGKVTVGQTLVLVQDSTLTADAGATIHMTGSAFQNESTNSANLAGLGNLTMIFEGGTEDVDPFEAGGAVAGGFVTANFLLDTLQLGGTAAGKIQLIDDFDNQDDGSGVGEAVYVNNLIMNAGATIDLNGLNLYYLNGGDPKPFFCGDATLNGYVDGGDLDILLADWGTGVPPANPRADLSGNFFVDGDDLDLILADWGKGAMPSETVPEPATLSLLGFGGLALIRRRRK